MGGQWRARVGRAYAGGVEPRTLAVIGAALGLACGDAGRSVVDDEVAPTPALASGPRIERAALAAVVPEGPAWLLQRVTVEAVEVGGVFVGWRIEALPPGWSAYGLRVGDVVTGVNGMAIETPAQAQAVWGSLADARALRVEVLRDGAARPLVLAIAGE